MHSRPNCFELNTITTIYLQYIPDHILNYMSYICVIMIWLLILKLNITSLIRTHALTNKRTDTRTHAHVHLPTNAPIHARTHTRTYQRTHRHTHARTYAHAHADTYTHISRNCSICSPCVPTASKVNCIALLTYRC